MFGFILLRHVNNKLSDFYWKECYTCIRRFYTEPILIIDDGSNKEFLVENLKMVNTTVVYDEGHRGAAELLPYYYFHQQRPFEKAVILHDSVFLQQRVEFECDTVNYLWTYPHHWDDEIYHLIHPLLEDLPHSQELMQLYWNKAAWNGPFGLMSMISWSTLNEIQQRYQLWSLLPKIRARENRMALERAWGVILCHYFRSQVNVQFGVIHSYMRWGVTFPEYLTESFDVPLVKVWSSR